MLLLLSRLLGMALLAGAVLTGCPKGEDGAYPPPLEKARALVRAGRYQDAAGVLTAMAQAETQAQPREIHLMQGLVFFKLGDYRRAVEALAAAQPESLKLQIYVAYLHLLLGDAQQAKAVGTALERRHGRGVDLAILQGNIGLKEQAYRDAERHFRAASALDGTSVKAAIGLANTYLLQRAFVKAEEHYIRAVLAANADASAYIALLHYYAVTGRYDDAIHTAAMAVNKYPNDVNLLMVQSTLYMDMGAIADGVNILEQALKRFPQAVDVKIRLIRGYFNLDRLEEAQQLIQSLMKNDYDQYDGLILLGEYYLRKGVYDAALLYFNKAQLINSNSYIVNYYVGLIYLIQNQLSLAVQFLEKSIQSLPSFIKSHLLLSIIYLSKRQYTLASEHAKIIIKIDPGNLNAHLINGISLYLQNYPYEAKYELDVAELFDEKNRMIPIIKMIIDSEINDFNKLEGYLSKIPQGSIERFLLESRVAETIRKPAQEFEAYYATSAETTQNYLLLILLANFYEERRNLPRAREYFLKAKAANGRSVIPPYRLAELALLQGDRAAAMAYLQQAIAINPAFIKAYRALGSLYEQDKDYRGAKRMYEQGLRYAPEDSVLLNNLAWLNLVHFGDKAAAYIGVRQALRSAPDDPDLQDTLAWWYYLNEDYQHALTLLKRLVEAHPANAVYRYHLGMVQLQAGEPQAARLQLRKALELGIDEASRANILEHLR
jgi:tetratricopeptide (TPR) repeat protein